MFMPVGDTCSKKAIFTVCDDNYIKGLIALLNSIIRNVPGAKIYLVHNLSKKNFGYVKEYIYKSEIFDRLPWAHLPPKKENYARMTFAKYQVEFIEENNFFYVDADVVVNKTFEWETPSNLSCEQLLQSINPKDWPKTEARRLKLWELMRQFILKEGGLIEHLDKITFFYAGAFFANRDWIINVFKPELRKCSIKYQGIPQFFYELEYFNAAIAILQRPVIRWKITQAIPLLEFYRETHPEVVPKENVELCNLIHYVLENKPWKLKQGEYPFKGGNVWWDFYFGGPINPLIDETSKDD